jgi:hypothetical protein
MEYLEGYHETVNEVENLGEDEALEFMWTLNGLLSAGYEQSEDHVERAVYHRFSGILEEADGAEDLANKTEDLHTEYYTRADEKAKYVEDVVTNMYQQALESVE